MIIKLVRWLQGFLLVRLKGVSTERFINLCSNRYIYLWDLKSNGEDYEFRIKLKDYYKLKPLAKKTGTLPLVKKRYGLPFTIQHYKKRSGYVFGFLLFLVILYILSLFIWDINVSGGYTYTQEAMVKFLRNNDIQPGLKKKDINCQGIEDLIRHSYNDIGWVSAEIKGTRLIIKITETNMPSPAVTKTNNCHIIASKDCIITKIVTRTGTPMAGIGDVVKKGDVLVSGVVDIIGDNGLLVRKQPMIADADIIGKTFYDYSDKFSLYYTDKVYTGKEKKSYTFSILLKKINLYRPRIPYNKYDIIGDEFTLHLNDEFYLPVSMTANRYLEYREEKKKYSEAEAKALAGKRLERFIKKLKERDVTILENNVQVAVKGNVCTANGKLVVLESVKDYKAIDDSEWRIIDTDESDGNDN
ncbi:sporulation protein YqfD [Anaerocolumna xylanovorans]|uniref:Similar to stage IV sporulation protein n=1 Tax=Anaerocolumna xylanovorans DSM 12503 TaxID=1121345 RepID=A0A1M7YCA0_9FIRM|nr:sporulation protein YqfD [Anaerocolumna xylanovorans]SHO50221.1 similar to stage IV sporulation protein [Anaerocolumna xylanovorans DSM 12503]